MGSECRKALRFSGLRVAILVVLTPCRNPFGYPTYAG
jgi:hypothetical protein